MLRVDFVTLFPEMVIGAASHSILKRAAASGLVEFAASNPRDFTTDRHRTVDDAPYGGGPGMVMMAGPLAAALDSVLGDSTGAAVVFPDPVAPLFTQTDAASLAQSQRIVFVCGHYEGIDQRVRDLYATHAFSIGDYVLTGGELPALVMADAVVRLLPGALGSADSLAADSYAEGLLTAPQYTRPEDFRGCAVPDLLTSGDHEAVRRWRRRQALALTRRLRSDLFARAHLEPGDLDMLSSLTRADD